jgi:mxaA protein
MLFRCLALGLALASAHSAAEDSKPRPSHRVALSAPRPFGYAMGDVIEHRITAAAEAPYALQIDFLPKPGPLSEWLEIRAVDTSVRQEHNRKYYDIAIRYQIFKGVKDSENLTIPAWPLRFRSANASFEEQAPAWEFTLAPLIASHTKDKDVLIRPELEAVPYALAPSTRVLALSLTGILAAACYLAWWYDRLPFLRRNRGPFARALREMQSLMRRQSASESYRAALRLLHQALNDTAGETVFAGRLEDFFRHRPAFSALNERLREFFQVSRRMFFMSPASSVPEDYPLAWLEALCRECRAIERDSR